MILIITTSKPQNYIRAQHNYKKKNGPDPLIMPQSFSFSSSALREPGTLKLNALKKRKSERQHSWQYLFGSMQLNSDLSALT